MFPSSCETKPSIRLITSVIIAFGLVGNAMLSAAQSDGRPLIVVTDEADAAFFERIAGEHCRVAELLASSSRMSDYHVCDQWVLRHLDYRLLVQRTESDCPCERFWCSRLVAANPSGRVVELTEPRVRGKFDYDPVISRVLDIHSALVSCMPEHKASFDANLAEELRRISWLQLLVADFN